MCQLPFSEPTIQRARRVAETAAPAECDPRVEALVNDLIGRVVACRGLLADGPRVREPVSRAQMPGRAPAMACHLSRIERSPEPMRHDHPEAGPRSSTTMSMKRLSFGVSGRVAENSRCIGRTGPCQVGRTRLRRPAARS